MAKRNLDKCKACGSENLFDGCLDKDGYQNDVTGTWTTICVDCGQDQNRKIDRRRTHEGMAAANTRSARI